MPGGRSPAVLELPFDRVLVGIHIAAHQSHRVRRTALAAEDTVGLGHLEFHAEKRLVIVHGRVGNPLGHIELLAHIAGSVHGLVVLDRSQSRLLDILVRQVQINPVQPLVGVPVVLNLVQLVIRPGRVVHDHDVIVGRIAFGRDFRIELHRRVILQLPDIAVQILVTPGESGRRFAKAQSQNPVGILQALHLALAQSRRLGPVGRHVTDFHARAAQALVQNRHHLVGIVGMLGFRHHFGRNYPVLGSQVVIQVPNPAVIDRRSEQRHHFPIPLVGLGRADHVFEEKVRLFQHIIEIEIVMREIEFPDIVLLHDARPQHVHRSEHPATSRLLLVGNALHIDPVLEIMVDLALQFPVERAGLDVLVGRQHVLDRPRRRIQHETFL